MKIMKKFIPTSAIYHMDIDPHENALQYHILNNKFGQNQVFGIRRKNIENPKEKIALD